MNDKNEQLAPQIFRNRVIDRHGKSGEDACEIMAAAIAAVDPYRCVKDRIENRTNSISIGEDEISKKDFDRIIVIGLGKASVLMAQSVIDIFGEEIDFAAVVTKDQKFQRFQGYKEKLKVFFGGHPIPSEDSVFATKSILSGLPSLTSRDVVIVLISGGGSALFTAPVKGVSLDDIQKMTDLLLKCGADITEINTLRKHLDDVKGGRLALRLQPAKIHTLILSDVVGDRLDMIASGPTVPDPTYFKDALRIIDKYQLNGKLPVSISSYLTSGAAGKYSETLKHDDTDNFNSKTDLIGSIFSSAKAGFEKAKSLGYNSIIVSTHLTGDTKNVSSFLSGIIRTEISHECPLRMPACVIFGGETTVEVTGDGLGGRNQDLALRMVKEIANIPGVLFISLATDGEDGPTDASGSAVDGFIFQDGIQEQAANYYSFIANSNSYEYLNQKGALIKTGSTGTNVNDLVFILFSDL